MSMQGQFLSLPDSVARTLESDPERVETLVFAEQAAPDVTRLDLRHLWHGVHFLLTGCTVGGEAPLAHAVFAPREVGDDVGYGPARVLAMLASTVPRSISLATTAIGLERKNHQKAAASAAMMI